jgi:lysine-N-methylase
MRCLSVEERNLSTSVPPETGSASAPAPADSPAYADRFECIGSACEDTCCAAWTVPVDRATWDKYQALPESPLRVLIHASVTRVDESAEPLADGKTHLFAKITMNEANHCPILTTDGLCRIQAELGADLLSHTCATYPRVVLAVGAVRETALTLSCPEAARLVLLSPDLLAPEQPVPEPPAAAGDAAPAGFWPIRRVVLHLVRNRAYPLWQRLFLLDLLCRRLDSIAKGELDGDVPSFLAGFEATVASGSLRAAMDNLPADRSAQLDVVLRLAGMMLQKSIVKPRFVACVQAFTAGIGNGPGATLESLTAHYSFAHDRHFAPFFARHPHILENFLVNAIVRRQFPFGREGMQAGATVDRTHEFALLAAQFVLMRGLLIGVAGFHAEAFSAGHVVDTVQAATKHFEHHPEFLKLAHALLVERGMDGARGLAILLRDAEAPAGADGASPAVPATVAAAIEPGRSA